MLTWHNNRLSYAVNDSVSHFAFTEENGAEKLIIIIIVII